VTAGADLTTIEGIVRSRGITEVVHFTTNRGLTGILSTELLKSRARLPQDDYLAAIAHPNCPTRKDPGWIDYVNLSVTRINDWMFDYSLREHAGRDVWWVVLGFDPEVLTHDGVVFTTTNNIYPSVRRRQGADGLAGMFADEVRGRYSAVHRRAVEMPDNWTTDRQAEVLYPAELTTATLQSIYVSDPNQADVVGGTLETVKHREVEIVCDEARFR
jgi:hypothetical protein